MCAFIGRDSRRFGHPVVGDLELNFEAIGTAVQSGLTLLVYTAAPGTPTADALKLLASWAATQDQLDPGERQRSGALNSIGR